MTIFNVWVTEEYTKKGSDKKETGFYRVGTAFTHKDDKGLNLIIPKGISISGKVLFRERKAGDNQPDVSEAEHGNEQG